MNRPRMGQRSSAAVAVVALGLTLASCTAPGTDAVPSDPAPAPTAADPGKSTGHTFEAVTEEGHTLWVRTNDGGPDLGNRLTITYREAEGCWVAARMDDGPQVPLLWPVGTVFEDAQVPTVRLPEGTVVESGDRIAGGGTIYGIEDPEELVPEACRTVKGEGFVMSGPYTSVPAE